MATILLVDDEPRIVQLVRDYLEHGGFTVLVASDGPSALRTARTGRPDLVVLDLGLPGIDGLDVARALRRDSEVPIIMLTARTEESDKLVGLELGADDYLTKPFSPKELLARVRRAMRRGNPTLSNAPNMATETVQHELLLFGDVKIDFTSMEATRGGKELTLTAQEFKLLRFLARSPNAVVSREKLLNEVWGYEAYPVSRTVDNHVAGLRAKLESDPARPSHIRTVHGVGYKFSAEKLS